MAISLFLLDFSRMPSPDFQFSHHFPMDLSWSSDCFAMFLVDLNRMPSSDLSFALSFPMALYGFPMISQCFW